MEKKIIKKGKYLTKLLRHDPEELKIEKEGWVNVEDLCKKIKITFEELCLIAKKDNKGRFVFNKDYKKTRVAQGHSLKVDLKLKPLRPPEFLFHGTNLFAAENILKEGILKKKRTHVHLSDKISVAKNVGKRHCCQKEIPVIFSVSSEKMFKDGYKFYLSDNKVWLTHEIPVKYLIKI